MKRIHTRRACKLTLCREFSRHSVNILPFLEQQALYANAQQAYQNNPNPFSNPLHCGLSTPVVAFACPSEPRGYGPFIAQRAGFMVAFTWYLGVSGTNYSTSDGVLFQNSRIRLTDITDGTSDTLLVDERPPSTDYQFGWWYAGTGQALSGSADMILGVRERNLQLITVGSCPPGSYPYMPGSANNQCDMFDFWSFHPGGANFVFADGSVHFLPYSANSIMPALASRAGGEVVSPP